MIKIIEDGMEWTLKLTSRNRNCEECEYFGCCENSDIISSLCGSGYRVSLLEECATPVQEEAKVYATHNKLEANPLIGSLVLYWDNESWITGTLSLVSDERDDQSPFEIKERSQEEKSWFPVIMKRPIRRLTQAQIIEAHPDLEGVVLVGGWV